MSIASSYSSSQYSNRSVPSSLWRKAGSLVSRRRGGSSVSRQEADYSPRDMSTQQCDIEHLSEETAESLHSSLDRDYNIERSSPQYYAHVDSPGCFNQAKAIWGLFNMFPGYTLEHIRQRQLCVSFRPSHAPCLYLQLTDQL
jgi:hypothetical protein